jgi:hypothetical protein
VASGAIVTTPPGLARFLTAVTSGTLLSAHHTQAMLDTQPRTAAVVTAMASTRSLFPPEAPATAIAAAFPASTAWPGHRNRPHHRRLPGGHGGSIHAVWQAGPRARIPGWV